MKEFENYNEVMINYLEESLKSGNSYKGEIEIDGGIIRFFYDNDEDELIASALFDDGMCASGLDITEDFILEAFKCEKLLYFLLNEKEILTKCLNIYVKTIRDYKLR